MSQIVNILVLDERSYLQITSGTPVTGYEVLQHPMIIQLASKYEKSPANIVIRWHLQMGGTLAAKSVTPSRIEENIKVWDFCLSQEEMNQLECDAEFSRSLVEMPCYGTAENKEF